MKKFAVFISMLFWLTGTCKVWANTPEGYFEAIDGGTIISGWTLDLGAPTQSIKYRVYADGPANDGAQLFEGATNITRGDVNSAKGVTGAHAFSYTIPSDYRNGYRKFYVYAVDPHGGALTPLNGSPKTIGVVPNGNSQISSQVGGKTMTIKTSNTFAGAIYSLNWDGFEFINSSDHGRELQSAVFYDGAGECYGPTEAGSRDDGDKSTSTSQLQYLSTQGNSLKSQIRMAYWLRPNYPVCPGPSQYWSKTYVSNVIMNKNVAIGFSGLDNVLVFDNDFYSPDDHWAAFFEFLTGYMPPVLNKVYEFNINSKTFNVAASNNTGKNPMIVSVSDGSKAMGIFSPQIEEETISSYIYTNFSNAVTKWSASISRFDVPKGHFKVRSYVFIGNLVQVQSSMKKVYETVMPTFDFNPIGYSNQENNGNAKCAVVGWVCDKNRYDLPVKVELQENGVVLAEAVANVANESGVSNSCGGTGNHRFRIIPVANSPLRDGVPRNLKVFAVDMDQNGNPNGNKYIIQDNTQFGVKPLVCLRDTTAPTVSPIPTVTETVAPTIKPKVAGDATDDGLVTLADFVVWSNEFSKKVTTRKSDFSGNGTVGLEDFVVWTKAYKGL